MYQELFDEKHRFVKGNLKSKKGETVQTGEKEPDILCADCDNRLLGGLEGYASNVLYGGNIPGKIWNEINQNGVAYTYAQGLDYAKFKLFLLSLIWRCSISKLDFYKQVDLGPYEETLRVMIYSGNPGKQMEFPCMMSTYRNNQGLPPQLVSSPKKFRQQNGTAYSMLVGGVVYIFYISQNTVPTMVADIAINEAGELRLMHMPHEDARKLLNNVFQADVFK